MHYRQPPAKDTMTLPIILEGQLYYDETKNDYLVVTKRKGEVVSYAGHGFRGMLEDEVFIERFQPVDPVDLTPDELRDLMELCPPGTKPKIGFIKD